MTELVHDPTPTKITTDPLTQRMAGTAIHGDTPFDVPFISRVEGNLWHGGCDNGLVLPAEIQHLVNMAPWWQYQVAHPLRSWHSFVTQDSVQQDYALPLQAAILVANLMQDAPTLVHCQAGLNRSSLVVALALMIHGRTADEAISLIREKRSPACLCNPAFEAWLRSDEALSHVAEARG